MIKILVFGELCTDKYVYGNVERLSPEAPVPILKPTTIVENYGMAGNVVENLKILSDDVHVEHIHQIENIVKTRYVEQKSNHMFMRLDEGETNGISPLLSLDTEIIGKILRSDIVIISDYNKGYLSEDIISKITEKSKFSVMDSKKRLTEKSIENLNFVKLNEIEYNQNKKLVSDNLEKFVITLGSKGAMFLNEVFGSNRPQETIDVSGAGDSFISAFTLMYYKTTDIKVSINFANEVCSDVVSKKGVSLPDKKFKISF